MNIFALYSSSEFKNALQEAGFSKINLYGKNLEPLDESTRSLYCVAEK
ncbi:hypothetical protein ACFL6I_11275 [candidate division KSB1 bacterium]